MTNYKSARTPFISIRNAAYYWLLFSPILLTPVFAMDDLAAYEDILENAPKASDEELDQLRGGFALPNGINVDFSYESVVSLNGVVTQAATFQLPDNISVVQNGMQNQAPQLIAPVLGTVIQNNLDNQFIQTLNTVNIEVSNLRSVSVNQGAAVFNAVVMPNL